MSLMTYEGKVRLGNCDYYLGSTENTVRCVKYGIVPKTICRYCKDRVRLIEEEGEYDPGPLERLFGSIPKKGIKKRRKERRVKWR